jgi:prolyl oligopeptidase
VLLDPHPLSADHTVDVTLDDISQDGRVLVYGLRRGGEDETELHVRDVAKRADLPDTLPRGLYRGVSLKPDGSGFYYSAQNRQTGIRVRYHAMGTAPEKDVEVFGAGYGPSQWIGADVAENGKHLLLNVQHGWARNEVFVQDLTSGPAAPVRTIVKDVEAHFRPQFAGDRLILQTDWKAPRWRIVEVDLADPSPARWREIVPEGPDTIQDFVLAGGMVVVHALHDVASSVRLYSLDGARLGELPMPGPGSAGSFQARWSDDEVFFDFNSYTTPRTTYRADVKTKKVAPWWRPEVPFASASYETKQVWYASKDGTRVPMFVTHRKGLVLDGRRPTLLTGYGGFNVSILPGFSATAAWWIEQGGVFAVPNLRGGGELRRGLASRGHARPEAERLRRLHLCRGVADRQPLHGAEPPRHPRGQQRRPRSWGGVHPAARAVPRRALRFPRPRHARLLPFPQQQPARPPRIRQRVAPGAVRVPPRLLAVPARQGGHGLSRDLLHHRGRGHARAAAAGAEDDGAGAGGHDVGPAGRTSLRH